MTVVRWKFTDVWKKGPSPYTWTVDINPNDGGTPAMQKNVQVSANLGDYRGILLQEGQAGVPTLSFTGVIVAQDHLEALETWFAKRVLLDVTDDLERVFRGIFTSFAPQRVRRPYNPWYHTYTAEMQLTAYTNASGHTVYGRRW